MFSAHHLTQLSEAAHAELAASIESAATTLIASLSERCKHNAEQGLYHGWVQIPRYHVLRTNIKTVLILDRLKTRLGQLATESGLKWTIIDDVFICSWADKMGDHQLVYNDDGLVRVDAVCEC